MVIKFCSWICDLVCDINGNVPEENDGNNETNNPIPQGANEYFIGCFTDNENNIRELSFRVPEFYFTFGIRVETCQTLCAQFKFTYSGVQFG